MSVDFQIAWECNHVTVEERVQLAPDRRTMLISQPLASAGLVRILANDDQEIPQAGLFSFAKLFGSLAAPFDLPIGKRTLTIKTSSGQVTLTLAPKGSIRLQGNDAVSQIAAAAQSGALPLVVSLVNGHLSLKDGFTVGPSSFVQVSGTAVALLGFGDPITQPDRAWGSRGQMLLPPWQIESLPNKIKFRVPRFLEPLRSNPELRVSYMAPVRNCRRCGASTLENDARLDVTGQSIMVRNEDLLYQAVLKILLTDKGSNPYHPWYGSTIRQRIGSKAVGGVAASISEDVRRALARLQAIQLAQGDIQAVSPKERIVTITNVRVSPHVQDPTTFLVEVEVQNASNRPVELSIIYAAPGTVALLGSNGLALGTQSVGLDRLTTLDSIGGA